MTPLRNRLATTLAAVATSTLLATGAQAAGSLVFTPPASTVDPGQAFAVQVRGASFTDNVVGGGFNMSFDASLLSLASVVMASATWDFNTNPGTTDNAAGTLSNVFFNAFNKLPTGDFDVATLNFVAKGPGLATLVLSASPSFPFANDLAEVIDVNFGTGSVNVVPEPATWASMLLGVALLPWMRRRMQAGR